MTAQARPQPVECTNCSDETGLIVAVSGAVLAAVALLVSFWSLQPRERGRFSQSDFDALTAPPSAKLDFDPFELMNAIKRGQLRDSV
jgi:hypothetical protein